ncbi:U-scoloptoxin(01)-Er1a-like [Macrosteles quadrilineatus]|uniref:U-scoloptoxin(01)-Er1a-like n=1 Tax=Macrosteles quadrilineatus TaxID=74068 RepID=UPI0023E2D168|nr:U-scoloptoxin(01)-Er1a-like [Macrosteles quadrilineatus]
MVHLTVSLMGAACLACLVYSQTNPEYPAYNEVPRGLSFTCNQKPPGYYADPEAQCQVWHWCLPSGQQFSFLCPNGTVFNQLYRVCDWYFNVDCPASQNFYNVNDDLYKDSKGNPI